MPAPKLELPEQPKTNVSSAVFNRPLPVGISAGLEQLGAGAENLSADLARQQAQTDVQKTEITLAPDGQVQVANPSNSIILGSAGQDYNRALADGLYAKTQASVTAGLTNIQLQHQDDPAAAKTAFDQYVGSVRQSATGLLGAQVGNALADRAQGEAVSRWGNLAEKNYEVNTRASLAGIEAHIDDTNNRLQAMARQGAINTDDYRLAQADLMDGYDALGTNKLYGYSPDRIESMKDHAIDMLNGQYVVGRIDDTFNRKGKNAALEAIRTSIDNNPDLDIGEADRNHLHNLAISRLAYLSDEQQSSIAALKPTVQMQVAKLRAGNSGPDAVSAREVDQTVTELSSLGAFKEAQDLQAASMVADRMSAFRNLSPDQKSTALLGAAGAGVGGGIASAVNSEQGALQYFVSKGWTPVQAAGIVGNLVHESGGRLNTAALNRGDGSDGSDSIGIGQWNGTRADALKAFAAAQGKPVADLGTQLAFVQHELETTEGAAAQRLKGATNAHDAAAAVALGYERPQGFQSGVPEQVLGWQNRLDQTNRLAATGGSTTSLPGSMVTPGVTTLGQPFTDAEAQANPWLRTEYRAQVQVDDASQVRFAKTTMESLDNAIKFTGNPSPDMIPTAAAALQIADRFPDQLGEQATKLRGALAGARAGFDAASGADKGADALAQANEMARSGNPFGLAVAENVKRGIEAGAKLLKDDQYEYARQADWIQRKPMPLTFDDPTALQNSMIEHGMAATKIAAQQKLSAVSALTPAETAQVRDVMQNSPLDKRLSVLTAIANANMPEPILKATLAGFSSGATLPFAIAGGIARDNPDAARGILQGQAILQSEPKFAPKAEAMTPELASAISPNDLPGPEVRAGIMAAARAAYAKKSFDASDTTGVINTTRMSDAIGDVTGGIRSYRGSSFIAPWYGARQEDVDTGIRLLTDADFAGAHTADGQPFPALALKPSFSDAFTWNNWRLQSVGDGKYLVYSGSDTDRQYLGATRYVRGAPAPDGKFVLDLGAKREAIERAQIKLPSQTPFSDQAGANPPFTDLY